MACFGRLGNRTNQMLWAGLLTASAACYLLKLAGLSLPARLLSAQARRAFAAGPPAAGRSRAANDSPRPDRAVSRSGGDADILDWPSPGAGRARRRAGGGRNRRGSEGAVPSCGGVGRRDRCPVALGLIGCR